MTTLLTVKEVSAIADEVFLKPNGVHDFARAIQLALLEKLRQEPAGIVSWVENICCFEPTEGNDYPTEFTELFTIPSAQELEQQ